MRLPATAGCNLWFPSVDIGIAGRRLRWEGVVVSANAMQARGRRESERFRQHHRRGRSGWVSRKPYSAGGPPTNHRIEASSTSGGQGLSAAERAERGQAVQERSEQWKGIMFLNESSAHVAVNQLGRAIRVVGRERRREAKHVESQRDPRPARIRRPRLRFRNPQSIESTPRRATIREPPALGAPRAEARQDYATPQSGRASPTGWARQFTKAGE